MAFTAQKTDGKLVSVVKQCQKAAGATADGIIGPRYHQRSEALSEEKRTDGRRHHRHADTEKMNLSAAPQADAEVNWSGVKYFEKAEFQCDCNGKYCERLSR